MLFHNRAIYSTIDDHLNIITNSAIYTFSQTVIAEHSLLSIVDTTR